MHQGVLAARYEMALDRAAAQLAELAARHGATVHVERLRAVQGRDRFERAMKHQEAIVACLDELLAAPPPERPAPRRARSKGDGVSE